MVEVPWNVLNTGSYFVWLQPGCSHHTYTIKSAGSDFWELSSLIKTDDQTNTFFDSPLKLRLLTLRPSHHEHVPFQFIFYIINF